jgi:xanthine dehydrogenase molybdenum-binding subunit
MVDELLVVGNPANLDKQAVDIVTGRLDYASDHLPGEKLFTRILSSPHAHAKIVSIDTSKALAMDGVEAVTTHEDCPTYSDTITFWGQEVAAVAAVDEHTAAVATRLIDVEYDVLPHVVDPDEAMEPGAPLVGVYPDSNLSGPTEVTRGDLATGMAEADVIVEEEIGWSNNFQHGPLDPRSSVVYWTGDHLYVWITSQNPHGQRRGLANNLGIPENHVHLISHGTGQGHGDKHGADWAVPAAVLAKKAGKPVQNTLSRQDNFLHAVHQYPTKLTAKVGFKDDGTITAADCLYMDNGGWRFGHGVFRQSYKCDHGSFRGQAVATNRPRMGAWRCVMDPQACFCTDIFMDMAAEELGMSPLDLRLKVSITPDMPDQDSGNPISSGDLPGLLATLRDAGDYNAKYHAPGTMTLPDGRMHGIGIRAYASGFGNMSSPVSAIVTMARDGTAFINVGTSRAGNGQPTACAHITAEKLGLKFEDVTVGDWGNTTTSGDGGGQGGSTRTITLGAAFYMAAEDARNQLFEVAAEQLGVTPEELDAGDSKIFVKADPTQFKTHSEVSSGTRGTVVGRGVGWPNALRRPVGNFPVGTPCHQRMMTGSVAEVAVDTETGEVEVLSFILADDMGRAIFWKGAENQIEGSIEISIGEAMLYEQIFDDLTGATLNASYVDNKWPTTLDVHTDRHTAIIVESDDACGPYGAKGLGEPPVTNYGVLALAVHNAIGGEWIRSVPIYPQKVLKALGKA